MLNPFKTPMQMLYEQAGVPHLAGGGGREQMLKQFETAIKNAITKHRSATGRNPTTEEVTQLENYLLAGKNPALANAPQIMAPKRPQTMARTAAMEPNANKLVDEFGRPYAPMIDPKTGKLTTPERAQGFTVGNQFEVNPQTRKARKGSYEKGYDEVARPDEFVQVANVGRTSNRTNQRSTLPSTEELLAMQHNAENAVDDLGSGLGAVNKAPNETYGMAEGPTSASQIFADASGAIENEKLAEKGLGSLREQLVMALNPQTGEKVARPLKADIERARQSFLSRGIEPDQEDIINAVMADANAAQHNYLGFKPTNERPFNDPKAGKASPEYLEWQEKMRAAGAPKSMWNVNPADWDDVHKMDYLLDTAPEDRLPFAANWRIEDLISNQGKKNVIKKAEGGFIPSPRDMRASLLVNGYAGGGRPEQPTPQQMQRMFANSRMGMDPVEKAYLDLYERTTPQMKAYAPSPKERIADLGQGFLEKMGVRPGTARRTAQTVVGGQSSLLPGGFGLVDAAAFHPVGFAATLPLQAAEMGHSVAQGNYDDALLAAAASNPGLRAAKGMYDKLKVLPTAAGRYAMHNPRIMGGMGASSAAGLNAYPDE